MKTRWRALRRIPRVGVAGMIVVLLLCTAPAAPATESEPGRVEHPCEACHPEVTASFRSDVHARAWRDGEGDLDESRVCASCHGETRKHLEEGTRETIFSFREEGGGKGEAQSGVCLGCHRGSPGLELWALGRHAQEGVVCTRCHTVHTPAASATAPAGRMVCYRCHREVRLQNGKRSRHPVREGKVTCGDCHNPHGTLSPGMIRADSTNELCTRCHADKRGPFVWEHPPVEEDCGTCHCPHGSVHDNLLLYPVPNLCQNCHAGPLHVGYANDAGSGFGSLARDAGARLFVGRSCLNCHSNVHGSSAPGSPALPESSGNRFLR